MFEKKIRYTDYNNTIREETVRFNYNRAEITDLDLKLEGGLEAYVDKMMEEQDRSKIAEFFRELILGAYGEKSLDGKHFVKKAPDGHLLRDDFEQTEAFSEVYMWLLSGTDAVVEFVNGIRPQVATNGDDRNVVAIEKARAAAEARYNSENAGGES